MQVVIVLTGSRHEIWCRAKRYEEGLEGLEGTAHIDRVGGEKRNERRSYREGGERIEATCGWNLRFWEGAGTAVLIPREEEEGTVVPLFTTPHSLSILDQLPSCPSLPSSTRLVILRHLI